MQYTTYGAFQAQMKDFYERTGTMMQFPEMMRYMAAHGLLSPTPPPYAIPEGYEFLSDAEFDRVVDTLPLEHADDQALKASVSE